MLGSSTGRKVLLPGVLIALLLALMMITQPALAARSCTIRYYITPMVGGESTPNDPLRPLVVDIPSYPHHMFATAWKVVYNPDRYPVAFAVVASPNHKPLLKNPELGILPDVPLDTPWYDMSIEELNQVVAVVNRFGFDEELVVQSDTYYDMLRFIVRNIDFPYATEVPTLAECPLK